MILSSGLIIAITVIAAFIGIFAVLDRLELIQKYGLELSGPFLMWRTERGKKLIDRISKKKKFWERYGNFALIVVGISMVVIFLLVGWSAYVATTIPASQAPSPQLILGIPGINPLIPIWYGILGLAIAIIIHEFSHGILARAADIKVKSLGLIFLVVPMGAFVEPDEDEVEEMDHIKRDRMYAVGPTANIVLAIILVLIFSSVLMGSVSAKEDGLVVNDIVDGSPMDEAGIKKGEQITEIGGLKINDNDDVNSLDIEPLTTVDVESIYDGNQKKTKVTAGVVILNTKNDYPADEGGLKKGDILYKMDGTLIYNSDDYDSFLKNTSAGQSINITYKRNGHELQNTTLTLKDKYESYEKLYPTVNKEEYKGKGYMGISVGYMGFAGWDIDMLPELLSHPYKDAETLGDYFTSSMRYIALPFSGLTPVPEDIGSLYQINGSLSFMPNNAFWIVANSIYWVFWLNLMVGLFNSLPAIPLDGG
ncbi:MAG: site-2 protease family protein [Thermoplasmatota archaeon]